MRNPGPEDQMTPDTTDDADQVDDDSPQDGQTTQRAVPPKNNIGNVR